MRQTGPVGPCITSPRRPETCVATGAPADESIGTNAIRTGHTPFPPMFYELCDRIGLMVVDEAFDGWKKKAAHDYGAEAFADWWQRDLSDFVRRDRNHPSVILWSMSSSRRLRTVPVRATQSGYRRCAIAHIVR